MRHAYLIIANKNWHLLNLLLETLDAPENDFYLLIDRKVKETSQNLVYTHLRYSRIVFLQRLLINWGGWSQIRAEFQLLKVALPQQYDYYHYLQGSDFPIKSREDISEFFLRNAGKEFIEFSPKNYGFAHWKCDYQHILVDNPCYRSSMILKGISHTWVKIQILIRRHSMMDRPSEMLYHGSALWSITNDFARYVLSRERDIRKRYCHALAADEVFMQTLIMKSPYKDRIYHFEERDGNVRYIDWEHRKGSSPKTFTAKEYELLMSLPESFLFARKFSDESVDVVLQIAKAITR